MENGTMPLIFIEKNKTMTPLQLDVLGVLVNHPKEKPITRKELAFAVNLTERDKGRDGADLRSVINALRVHGYPVCAAGTGYYYASKEEDLDEFILSFSGRIEKQMKALIGLREAKAKFKPIEVKDITESKNQQLF